MDEEYLTELQRVNLNELDVAELEDHTILIAKRLVNIVKNNFNQRKMKIEALNVIIQQLKKICTKGRSFQNIIACTNNVIETLKKILTEEEFDNTIKLKCLQLLANLCVQNSAVQSKIKEELFDVILEKLGSTDDNFINVAAMIVHNMLIAKTLRCDKTLVQIALRHYKNCLDSKDKQLPDFIILILEYMICEDEDFVHIYKHLEEEEEKLVLFFIQDHIENESNSIIDKNLLMHLSLTFKQKSDCILKTVSSYVNDVNPLIVVALLDIISTCSAQEKYRELLKSDHALFLNTGCLLQAIHKIGKESQNTFSSIQKLDALALASNDERDFEKEFSFNFKTKLVKIIANLSHKNTRNQELAREMEIMQSIFECTNADARNPLIKEWSLLAIRNLLEENLENQNMIRNMVKKGDAPNDVVKEFGLETGVFRIEKR